MRSLIYLLVFFLARALSADPIERCARLVSLAPSITECIFALQLGSKLVGVTRYCTYPEEAKNIDQVGGYLDINLEALLQKKPSTVILLNDHLSIRTHLQELGVPVLEVDHRSVSGLLESIRKISDYCGVTKVGAELSSKITQTIEQVRRRVANKIPVSTLVVVDRESDRSSDQVYISGQDGFYSELLTIAGGKNVYTGSTANLPSISAEGLIALHPEVILEVVPEIDKKGWSRERIIESWKKISFGRDYKVLFLDLNYAVIPGPRVAALVERLSEMLHPGES